LKEHRPTENKTLLARTLGVSRSTLYYVSKKEVSDWKLKIRIEHILSTHPAYGSRRIALEVGLNRKRVRRVMRAFGLHPYRRRGRKWRKTRPVSVQYPNLLQVEYPQYSHHIWVADFTELAFRDKKIYVSTVLDLYTRQVVGLSVATRKGTPLVMQSFLGALLHYPRPGIFHSDNGREYEAESFRNVLARLGVIISRSHPGSPWENGYQESFYSQFKVDLGDPNRFQTLGELVAEIYFTVWTYNHTRIHSRLKMPPVVFAQKQKTALSVAA